WPSDPVAWNKANKPALFTGMAILAAAAMPAHAEDLFANGKTTINDTFGSGSTVVWILYILEIIAAVFTYVKTKNLAMFGGIAAVMVFINVAFGIIPS
uniref:type IV conjugative transfer system pilin TraA n=1 Tax=Pluralibacter gergoviae TaxID=61647 RepID=UPI0009C15218